MSSNKGKDGELRALILVAKIGQIIDNVDVTRPTTTNTADQGADLFITHPPEFLKELAEVAGGLLPLGKTLPTNKINQQNYKSRVDVKTTDKKIQRDIVLKFISDCAFNPNCTGHILMGGANLTGPATKTLEEAQSKFASSNKTLLYISNEGIKNLETHYQPQIEQNDENN